VFLPISDGKMTGSQDTSHWSLLIVSIVDGLALHYDSRNGANNEKALLCVRQLEIILHKTFEFDCLRVTPKEEHVVDSGIIVCVIMRHLLVKRLLAGNLREKVSMSMSDRAVDTIAARKEMISIMNELRKEAMRTQASTSNAEAKPAKISLTALDSLKDCAQTARPEDRDAAVRGKEDPSMSMRPAQGMEPHDPEQADDNIENFDLSITSSGASETSDGYTEAISTLPTTRSDAIGKFLQNNARDAMNNTTSSSEEADAVSIYSYESTSSMRQSRDQYLSEWACHLFEQIYAGRTDAATMIGVLEILPSLLGAFARKLGGESASQVYLDLMAFIYKRRR
jgi:hypothetical protein